MSSQKIKCIVSGIEKRISGATMSKMAVKFGTQEQFIKHFVCREAKKLLKQRVQPEQVQLQLKPAGVASFSIDLHVLARLKLLKKTKSEKAKANLNLTFNPSEPKQFDSLKSYVEEMTGGKDGCQIASGGTCIRPDIYYDNEFNKAGCCSPCDYKEFCLCASKRVK